MKQQFSTEAFWGKAKGAAKKAGQYVMYTGLVLFYILQRPDVPKSIKAAIIGALAYFIAPIDAIPDLIAGLGYTDDLGALSAVLVQCAAYIDDEVKQKARSKLSEWFGAAVEAAEMNHTKEEAGKKQ